MPRQLIVIGCLIRPKARCSWCCGCTAMLGSSSVYHQKLPTVTSCPGTFFGLLVQYKNKSSCNSVLKIQKPVQNWFASHLPRITTCMSLIKHTSSKQERFHLHIFPLIILNNFGEMRLMALLSDHMLLVVKNKKEEGMHICIGGGRCNPFWSSPLSTGKNPWPSKIYFVWILPLA